MKGTTCGREWRKETARKGGLLNGRRNESRRPSGASACGLLYPLISAVYRVDYPLSIGSKPKGYRGLSGRWLHVTGIHAAVIHTVRYNGQSRARPRIYCTYTSGRPPLSPRTRQINQKIYIRAADPRKESRRDVAWAPGTRVFRGRDLESSNFSIAWI